MSASPEALSAGAGNTTASVVQEASSLLQTSGGRSIVAVFAILAVGTFVSHFLSATIDDREPPALKPVIPLVGHIINMIRQGNSFLTNLSKHKMPIASIPMLNGKIYAVWDPALIGAVQRNKHLSFVPFVMEFGRRELAYDDATDRIVRESGLMDMFFDAIHEGMSAKNTNRMNASALRFISSELDNVCPGGKGEFIVDNVYLWTRDLMTKATCQALFGSRDPISGNRSLLDDVWVFETQLSYLLMDVAPSVVAPKAYQARKNLQKALNGYYGAGGWEDEDASGIVKARAGALNKFGVPASYIGTLELALVHVGTSNTIPTLFWFVSHVITRPELVARIRNEAEAMVERKEGQDEVTVNVDELADKCPLLVSCYREAIRLGNKAVGNRRVLEDTTISDGKGRTYLLKKGIDVMMPSEPLHRSDNIWAAGSDGGSVPPNATEFDSDRFLDIEKNKTKRAHFLPFGGGRHLCPGRNFAFAENLGFMVSLLLGFDVGPTDGDWTSFEPPAMDRCTITGAVSKPVNDGKGFGMKVTRREGWQGVRWRFTSGGVA